MNVNLINDIINDYTKIYDELYRKKYNPLNELLDKSKQDLNSLKEEITSLKEKKILNNDSLSEKNNNFLLCIKEIIKNKLNKYIIDFLNILKKYIQYKLWTKSNSHETINIMKEISDNQKSNIECMNKIVEVIQTLIFASYFELNENDTINIYLINLRVFHNTNNYQNYDFKNPIRLLFIALTEIVYKSNNNELIIKITKFLFSLYIKDDDTNSDNEYLELLKDFKNNIFMKCLGLELLSQGLKLIKTINKDNNNLDDIINNKIILVIKNSLNEIKQQSKNNDYQYIHLLKLCRLSMIIITNYNIDYDILQIIINYLKEDNKMLWQKNISMECLQEILNNSSILIKIYNYNKELISNIFSILSSIYEQYKEKITQYNTKNNIAKKIKIKKQIEKNHIYLEGDEISIIKENESNDIINNIKECLKNIINSFSSMMNDYKISMNAINNNLSKEQQIIKEIIILTSSNIKSILFNLIEKEYNLKEFDQSEVQKTLGCLQNIIILYSSLNIVNIRDEYLELICRLCLNFDNDKNISMCSALLSLSKCTHLFNQKSFIIIFHSIEKIHIKYNYNKNEKNKNFDLIIKDIFDSYHKFFAPNEMNNPSENNSYEIEYKNEKIEKQNLLCSAINTMFIDSKSLNTSSLRDVIGALFECLKMALNNDENNKNENEREEIIIFHLTKILTLALLNIENIFILFDDYIIPIINLLIEKKIILNFTVNLICSIIKEILINYKKIENNIKDKDKDNNMNKDNNWWLNDKWQKKVFTPLTYFTSNHNLIELTKNRLFICVKTIIEQSGNYIDLFGWESILKICQILINYNIEEIFLIIKLILNDYNAYLTIFNVIPIITLLGTFISYQKDRNICFNSIELFWSCTNIVEKYHKGKIIINESQQKLFETILKEQKIDNFDIFYNGLYYKIFSQLLRINSDFRNDIRRSAIKVFTEIFVSKINNIEYENCFKIINDIFFNTFVTNSQKYIDNEKNKIINEDDLKKEKENEIEQTLHASLLSIIKILKSYCSSEQKNENENIEKIFTSFLKKLYNIIPYGTITLNTDILHGVSEIKNTQFNNKFILPTKLDIYFEIMNKTKEYINSPRFKMILYNKMKCIKFLNCILNTLTDFFCNESNYKVFTLPLNQIFNKIFEILDCIFSANFIIEQKMIQATPLRLTEIENCIYIFIENIPIVNEQYMYDFIMRYINFDVNKFHTGALCKRAFECLINIMDKNKDSCLILKDNGKDILYKFFEKFISLFQTLNNDNIIKYFTNNNKTKDIIYNDFITLINKFFISLINKIESNNDEILLKIIQFTHTIYEQCVKEIKLIKDTKNVKEINAIYLQIIDNIIVFMFIELLPFIYTVLNEKENELQNIENNLLKMLYFGCDKIINSENMNDASKIIKEEINNTFINHLFNICKYQSNDDILSSVTQSKLIEKINKDQSIFKFINFKKNCTSLLITNLNDKLSQYKKDYENKNKEDISLKIISLLNKIKDLEVFPDIINIKDNKEKNDDNNIENNNGQLDKNKNKKIHIFYLYNTIVDFIIIDNKEVHLLIKEILLLVLNGIELPPLQKISFEEK